MEEFYHKVKDDIFTEYMACSQYIDWDVDKICLKAPDGFIVQEVLLEQMIDGEVNQVHYYEAWHVKDGECQKEKGQESHDLFCIGHPLDTSDAMIASIGHFGNVSFIPYVFWIECTSELYRVVNQWSPDTVREANGLKATYYSEKIEEKFKGLTSLERMPFAHRWDFRDDKLIYETVLKYCKTMYHPDNKIDRLNFKMFIDDAFPEGVYPEVKAKIIRDWEICE